MKRKLWEALYHYRKRSMTIKMEVREQWII
jgi:hypothetical protein